MTNKAKYLSRNPAKRRLLERFLDRTRQAVAAADPRRVLDVGVGEGFFWEGMEAFDVVGIDLRRDALVECSKRAKVRPVEASALALPFADDSFDLVVAIEILEHLLAPDAAIAEIARVAKTHAIVTVPWEPWFSLGVLAGSAQHWRRLGREPEHIQAFGPSEIGALLTGCFRSVEVSTCFPWLVAHAFK